MNLRRAAMLVLGIAIETLQYRLWVGENSLAHVNALEDRSTRLEVENLARTERNKILRAEIQDLKSGMASIEEKARTEFGLIKEGETFFLLVDETPGARSATGAP